MNPLDPPLPLFSFLFIHNKCCLLLHLLMYFGSLSCNQHEPRSDCFKRNSLIRVHIFLHLLEGILTLNAPITTKLVCFFRLLKCLRSLYGKQCGPRSDCSYRSSLFWSMLFASLLNSSVMLGNYLQQTTSTGNIFRCIFFSLRFKGLNKQTSFYGKNIGRIKVKSCRR